MLTYIVLLSAFVQGVIALFVLLKNHKSLTNILFFCMSFFVSVWAILNFLPAEFVGIASRVESYRAIMAAVVAQNTFFFLFAHTYPERSLRVRKSHLGAYLALSSLTFVIAFSPLIFSGIQYDATDANAVATLIPGAGMPVFMLHAAISVFFGLRALYRQYKYATGIRRPQNLLIFIGSVILWGIVPVTNFAITLAASTSFFAKITPVYTLAFSSILAYAIVRQRLFDIRAAVARSVAYLLSLGMIGALYVLLGIAARQIISADQQLNNAQELFYFVFALVSALLYQPIKFFFDKATNRFFYRDAYDPQLFLDELNGSIVGTIETATLLKKTTTVIQRTIKVEHCYVVVPSENNVPTHIVGSGRLRLSAADQRVIESANSTCPKKIVITDDLDENESPELKRVLIANNIGLLARLSPDKGARKADVAYLLIGAKQSGNIFTKRDILTIGIVADELVVAIQNALRFEEIERFNETLQQKVAEATLKLKESNEKLKALNETKDDFIGMASHQLRTPLTSVKGYLSLVIDGDAGKITATQKKLLTQAFVSSQRMVYLIADLLNVSRLRTGKFIIERTPTSIVELIDEEIGQLREVAAARGVKLEYEPPKDFPVLPLDETKTRQVIMNFMDNAIYYTPVGGTVRLELRELSKSVELRVVDDGIGVPKADQHHLFTKFYRAKNAQRARPDGTGLGLFMAKKVIAAQGGAVIFSSAEGKGSTFGFSFPKDLPTGSAVVEGSSGL